MTYSLHTLTHSTSSADEEAEPQNFWARFAQEISLLLGAGVLLLCLLALLSYQAQDPAWSTSGAGGVTRNWMGRSGALFADLAFFISGYSVWWCFAAGLRAWLSGLARWLGNTGASESAEAFTLQRRAWVFWLGLMLLMSASASLEWTRLYRWESNLPGHSGGILGYQLGRLSMQWLGFTGSGLVGLVLGVIGLAMVFKFSWGQLAESIGERIDRLIRSRHAKKEIEEDFALGQQALREREQVLSMQPVEPQWDLDAPHLQAPEGQLDLAPVPVPAPPVPPMVIEPAVTAVPRSERVVKERQKPLFNELPDSKLPQVDLLDALTARQETVSPETLEMTSRLIEKKLSDFGVKVRVVAAAPGPVITRYEIEPDTGVKGSQIVNLAKDLARSLSLVSIRVIETIPGKNFMALELPNAKRQSIKLSEILGSQIYNEAKSMLTMGLGKDIIGNPVVADLAKMPHVLVAGTTGSGKSVGINAMILSLLYKAEARDVRLLMIDPKMLEMSVYEGIPHLLAPVVTDMRQAAHGLNWCVAEMEKRYKLMSKMGVRNLAGYNQKIDDATAREEFIYNPFSLTPDDPEPLKRLPHIVVVIDELADLMMVVGKKIEELIARLAQKARAAGIHLILATQRPSVDVITGLIKANIPTRIAFQVSSKIDSRTILDQMGAEALLGMGDMLYMPSGTGFPIRVHGAFVSDEEVHRVVSYLKSQGEPDYIEGVLEGGTVDDDGGMLGEGDNAEKDPMYDQAVEVVLKNRKASISLVQRHLKIGYNRAARLVEDMEKAGLVSAMSGSGQREILVPARAE
ncbi:cell division protein FtsK [Limnohabitans sp. MMS-10A-160]|uniref:DNA translocase FtsK n=1 Tax=unclassified Limnohabitans TaxID=2626134 RepID=UPI000D339888|nr:MULTISPECIES: DNA translocase FtsK [unclassified Limnohabitans]PUE18481.1 cell division protein FtsK [Limnohabitans sp. MMS-10A-192]PUE23373.1 cell division protein FtsK [Limnohabitans sp. MMS-10A-160]